MNNSVFKITIFFVSLIIIFLNGANSSAQLPLLDQLTMPTNTDDTTKIKRNITIDNVNTEIEFTDNLITKTNISEISVEKQKNIIEQVDEFNKYITKQGKEFKQFENEQITHVFLINAKNSWTEYHMTLRNYQNDLQSMIREIQGQQSFYILNRDRWKSSLPDLGKSLSYQIRSHINSNLKKMDGIIKEFDSKIKNLISAENKIIQDIIFIDGVLKDINDLIYKRKSELFKQNEKNIFSVSYRNSFSGSFVERLKVAFRETSETFGYFYSSVKRSIFLYLVIILILVLFFFFIRKNYIKLNYNDDKIGFFSIDRIIIQKPLLTLFAIIILMWTMLVPYSPVILNFFFYLGILVLLFLILSPIMEPFIKKIEIAVIILLVLSGIEMFSWYFGNYSRFYLLVESTAGIFLTFKYILPGYKIEKIGFQSKKLLLSSRIIIVLIFVLYSTAFISNIFGFINLTIYCLRLSIYTGVVSIVVHGFYLVFNSLTLASVDVLNIYYPEIIRKYGDSILLKLNRFLKLILGFFWISGMLRISEINEYVNYEFVAFFTNKVKIGSLSFSLGNLTLFIFVLYFTYAIASFVKQILEREILAKHKLKRGLAASISLTIRIFIVFFGTLVALSVSGLDLGKIGIIAGALSVGIGFGLQNVVSNFISGLILVYEKPVKEGDTVEVETLIGRVSNIGIRSSTITTYSGAEVVVPNSNLISNQLINWTLSDNRKRIEVKVGTAYGTDPIQVLDILLKAALSQEKVLKDPLPRPLFEGFGDSSLNFRLLFWVHFEDGFQTQSDVAVEVYKLFKENNIQIPFPQLDLHIQNNKEKLSDELD